MLKQKKNRFKKVENLEKNIAADDIDVTDPNDIALEGDDNANKAAYDE